MSSYPFGGHPQFGYVKVWAKKNGIEVQDCVTEDASKLTIFVFPDGKKVPIAGILDKEYVAPRMMETIERRLGMPADWFKPINRME